MLLTDEWNRTEYKFTKLDHGKFQLKLPPGPNGQCMIPHKSIIKVLYGHLMTWSTVS